MKMHVFSSILFIIMVLYSCVSNAFTSRINLIFDPPDPIRDPHWPDGTNSWNVSGVYEDLSLFNKF
jgi:hypothetical protein